MVLRILAFRRIWVHAPRAGFDGKAEEAANFYSSLLPDSHMKRIDIAAVERAAEGQPVR
jgi:predicted 3-demethylubiquinone-9 3-methyltransferase (glyoxalase superfamily)